MKREHKGRRDGKQDEANAAQMRRTILMLAVQRHSSKEDRDGGLKAYLLDAVMAFGVND